MLQRNVLVRFATGGLFALALTAQGSFAARGATGDSPPEAKPGTYWWWMGSAVDSVNLRENLRSLREAGIGGVLVVPIYGVKGAEDRFVNFLSPRWMRLFDFAVKEARRQGLWLDMSTGTGWPFGGRHVSEENAAKRLAWTWVHIPAKTAVDTTLSVKNLQAAILCEPGGKRQNLTVRLASRKRLQLSAASSTRRLLLAWWEPTGQHVKRAAPGNRGLVLDPFSTKALHTYVFRFDTAFANSGAAWPRAQYHDSFEYYGANWTGNFLEVFHARRGYDLANVLPLLLGFGSVDSVARVKHDYRQTLSDLHLDYIRAWVAWAHDHGCLTRNQAHGAPGNLLDLYAAADIPETEAFGSTPFPIPGFRRDPGNIGPDTPDPLVLRFASSAAHISGKPWVSSESCTWLREHFRAALSQVKPEIDQLFLAGVNQLSYHGSTYSPLDAAWPGWLFYASVAFQPANSIWHDFPALNAYVRRCQAWLQRGQPDNDLLFYWPVHDIWQDTTGLQRQLSVHNLWWIQPFPYGKLARTLLDRGVAFDFVSDAFLAQVRVDSGRLVTGGSRYQAVVVPECRTLPLATWWKLTDLARQGATVLFYRSLPTDVPGLRAHDRRRQRLLASQANLHFQSSTSGETVQEARLGTGRFVLAQSVEDLLQAAQIHPEEVARHGVGFIRRRLPGGSVYFLADLSARPVNDWLTFARPFCTARLVDPLTGEEGEAAVRQHNGRTQVYLQLQPGQSCLLYLATQKLPRTDAWVYAEPCGKPVPLEGSWRVDFLEGGPEPPEGFTTSTLESWTVLGNAAAKRFAGTARYTLTFRLPQGQADDWLLQLGDVRESARVRLNGQHVGVLWSLPFQTRVGRFLKPGWNTLQIDVTNLAANRIRDLDRRGVPWKRFYDINFVNIRYKRFDASTWDLVPSGLLGPVRLVPLKIRRLSETHSSVR